MMAEKRVIYDIQIKSNANAQINNIEINIKKMDAQVRQSGKTLDDWFNRASGGLGGIRAASQAVGKSIKSFALDFAPVIGAVTGAIAIFKNLNEAWLQQVEATGKLRGVLISTNNVYSTSTKELEAYATQLARTTGISDESIQSAQAMLLTFKGISAELFQRTTKVVADMSSLFGGLQESAVGVGKALEQLRFSDLARRGVTFTESQKEMITAMRDAGQVAAAQTVILEALEGQIGGLADTMGETAVGSVNKFKNAWDDFKQVLGEGVETTFRPIREFFTNFLNNLNDLGQNTNAFWTVFERDLLGVSKKINQEWLGSITNSTDTIGVRISKLKDGIIDLQNALKVPTILPGQREAIEGQINAFEKALGILLNIKKEEDDILAKEEARNKTLVEMAKLTEEVEKTNKTALEKLEEQQKEITAIITKYNDLKRTATDPEIIISANKLIEAYRKQGDIIQNNITAELAKIKPELTEQEKLLNELVSLYEKSPAAQEAVILDKLAIAQDLLTKGAGEYTEAVRYGISALEEQLSTINKSIDATNKQVSIWENVDKILLGQKSSLDILKDDILTLGQALASLTDRSIVELDIMEIKSLVADLKKDPFIKIFDPEEGDFLQVIGEQEATIIRKLDELFVNLDELLKNTQAPPIDLPPSVKIQIAFDKFRKNVETLDERFIDFKNNLKRSGFEFVNTIKALNYNLFNESEGVLRRQRDRLKLSDLFDKEVNEDIVGWSGAFNIYNYKLREDAGKIIRTTFSEILDEWKLRAKKAAVLIGNSGNLLADAIKQIRDQGLVQIFQNMRESGNSFASILGGAGQAALVASQKIWEWVKQLEVTQVIMQNLRESIALELKDFSDEIAPAVGNLSRAIQSFGVNIVDGLFGSGERLREIIDNISVRLVGLGALVGRILEVVTGQVRLRDANFRDIVAAAKEEFLSSTLFDQPLSGVDNIFTGTGTGGGGINVRQPDVYNIPVTINFNEAVVSTTGTAGLAEIIIQALQQAGLQGQNVNLFVTGVTGGVAI